MAQLPSIIQHLETLLSSSITGDSSLNGLQVESSVRDVQTVAVAVDAGLSVIEQAVHTHKAQLLIVHHGLIWDQPLPLTGALGKKVALLLGKGCSLYASHLPLDENAHVGNGFELARFLALEQIEPFFSYKGGFVGAKGMSRQPRSIADFMQQLSKIPGAITPLVLAHGKPDIRSVGIVTGSGAFAIKRCVEEQLDLLISGEPKQEVYHLAKELGVNAIFAGHYATETFGVRAVGENLAEKFGVRAVFIDEPTGI